MTKPLLIYDEAHALLGGYASSERLREKLREFSCVPPVSYRVQGDKVFVFSLLVSLVQQRLGARAMDVTPELASELVEQAWISAEKAVVSHAVMPLPYETIQFDGDLRIYHRPFNAVLPGSYENRETANEALAQLLLGKPVGRAPAGDTRWFDYNGQAMQPRHEQRLSSLPANPLTYFGDSDEAPASYGDVRSFVAGHPMLDASYVESLRVQQQQWKCAQGYATRLAEEVAPHFWKALQDYGVHKLGRPSQFLCDFDREDADVLCELYPELSMLNDATLLGLYNDFSSDVLQMRKMVADRSNEFLFFLLGQLAALSGALDAGDPRDVHSPEGSELVLLGRMAAYGVLQGSEFIEASEFALACLEYERALSSLTGRANDALNFLAGLQTRPSTDGRPIRTLNDMFRVGRKTSVLTVASQSLSDISATTV